MIYEGYPEEAGMEHFMHETKPVGMKPAPATPGKESIEHNYNQTMMDTKFQGAGKAWKPKGRS